MAASDEYHRRFILKDLSNGTTFTYHIVANGRADHAHGQYEESAPLSQALLEVNQHAIVESLHNGKPIRVQVMGFGPYTSAG
ncbi:GreA/GreB family elongation factor [Nocardia ninae]|uniref:Uncharacterized protein n=1 Tax=Nocardia ninae NBRC 108245 TaxID=1210091 RepID=A0A511MG14_9NOCA|nr:GreA/GreB family elongation factor [Nocardia ninae]GEM38836.1 hypothetical protein NN4_33550 [Nocardia ninae NBRC 108245]